MRSTTSFRIPCPSITPLQWPRHAEGLCWRVPTACMCS
jgi:hypothetical protein